MLYRILWQNNQLFAEIKLPSSKSISNRLLILQALADKKFDIHNLSDSKDTQVLLHALGSGEKTFDIGHAGTSMRFLTAYCALLEEEHVITGSERMQQRPIAKLVDALRQLNVSIDYLGKEGYPPIKIHGGNVRGNAVTIDGSISSQYITALLLIAPFMPDGLQLTIKKRLVSKAYVQMTLNLMGHMGIHYKWTENTISIPNQKISNRDIMVEADWSAASYWYTMVALSGTAELTVHGLQKNSYQGDSVVAELFEEFGVYTTYENNKIILARLGEKTDFFTYDFLECPDLVQTLVVTCVLTNTPFKITGAETLRIKETDRIAALQNELAKCNATISETKPGMLEWDGKDDIYYNNQPFHTYDDHRMAMALAPAAMAFSKIAIDDPEVVVKSYPGYWIDLEKAGFTIEEY